MLHYMYDSEWKGINSNVGQADGQMENEDVIRQWNEHGFLSVGIFNGPSHFHTVCEAEKTELQNTNTPVAQQRKINNHFTQLIQHNLPRF